MNSLKLRLHGRPSDQPESRDRACYVKCNVAGRRPKSSSGISLPS
jgi:hypothetical protein